MVENTRAIFKVDKTIPYKFVGVGSLVNEGKNTTFFGVLENLGPSSGWTRLSPTSVWESADLSMKARRPSYSGWWSTRAIFRVDKMCQGNLVLTTNNHNMVA